MPLSVFIQSTSGPPSWQSENQVIDGYCFPASWAFSPTKWGNSCLSPNPFLAVIIWTQNAASSHEKCKAESSLWWLSGESSFSGARKLRNSSDLKKLCRAWRFPSANSWQIFPKGNPCPLKSSPKYLQYCLATHCYKKKNLVFKTGLSARVFSYQWGVHWVSMKSSVRCSRGGGGVTTRTKYFWVIAKYPVLVLHAENRHVTCMCPEQTQACHGVCYCLPLPSSCGWLKE